MRMDARRIDEESSAPNKFVAALVKRGSDAVGSVIPAAIAGVKWSPLFGRSMFPSVVPGYPLSGCSSAEPDSVSPVDSIFCFNVLFQYSVSMFSIWTLMP